MSVKQPPFYTIAEQTGLAGLMHYVNSYAEYTQAITEGIVQ